MNTALILVDMQIDYFPGGKWELVGIDAASFNAQRLLAAFRSKNAPIFHIQHIAKQANAPFFVAGTPGAEIHQSVQPQKDEKVIQKEFPNSFHQTSLLQDLRNAGADNLVISGAMTHMCIDATTRAATDLGFNCTVAFDACATRAVEFYGRIVPAEQVHCAFMSALAFAYAKVVPASEALSLS